MQKTLLKSFLHSFVLKSTLIFAFGAFLTAAIFYFAFQEQGTTYGESYKILADLDRILVNKSLLLFSFTLLLSIAGIVILAILNSHRVAGALHKLGMHTQKISSGDLAAPVRLRRTDVLHELADDFNELSGHYRGVLAQLDIKTRELAVAVDNLEKQAPADGDAGSSEKISERIDEIRKLLDQIRL